ncbi:MAG TPA: YraN family protein [Planctomycetota bacterium]|nr:YraN family protein [Planctomycetota bacterium]OQC21540.1 MAG: hypothetical protein BWX69_00748 [Planctomycetes bacterium ADurb.Bin069]HNR98594.1 YraN family protein [Planctomycetota bacterium]HNU26139.1 YraN family protein [Planctomycetota bacterium]HOE28818.1 YraN family protein [Planctomycetota bacterium]
MPRARLPWVVRAWVWLRALTAGDLGRAGELAAAAHLRCHGLHVVARNWRGRRGELDIVAVDAAGTLVFVEVKTSRSRPGSAWERVDAAKEARLRDAADAYLAAFSLPVNTPQRFDIVVVAGDPRRLFRPLELIWAENVFGG